ncbi:MAG: hypothetical protein ACHQ49_10525 [Elusimicrobiota bacterium]
MEEKKEEGSSGKCGCGMRCGCCACKAIKGLLLLVLGGFIGYGIGHCHRGWSHRMCHMCPMTNQAPEQSESAPMPNTPSTPKKAK